MANLLISMQLERRGYRRNDGVEQVMLAQARRRGTRIRTLESADLQLGLFDSMSDIEAERYLLDTLDGLADGSAARRAGRVIEAWRSGKAAERDAALSEATSGGSETADFTRRKLLGQRNPDMASRIDTLMGKGDVLFVGVGYLHLMGENGLPQLLAQRGYLVERVY
ncbi:TraB/GumN family protein [Massilia sp. Se16.2.3]|uniref:TraB/GumN family protein n=1 Tax=Massilia sp. Se16.2.3 TaxID=2709303 RepID=UPI001603DE43|nr:TraB/GumN family protein [Massilia sp. Se16.2.3]QNA99194.1 TraB/GumN family protein [Massilia sp. Se16.2.3]